jgi:hypothetical protein
MAVGGSNLMRLKDKNKLKQLEGRLGRAQSRFDKSKGDSMKRKLFSKEIKGIKGNISDFKKSFGISTNTGPLKINNRGLTPTRTSAKGESKIRRSDMMKGMPGDAGNQQPKKKKVRRNAAGTMGQMAYGGKVKKMMGGGMAKKAYKKGGMTKKCPRDGIAMRGKTRA